MFKPAKVLILMCGLILAMVVTANSQDQIELSFEQKIIEADEVMVSGVASIYLVNNGDSDLVDAEAWIEGEDKVFYDNRTIYIGDVVAGSAKGVMERWFAPVEKTTEEPSNLPMFWKVEYTDNTGARVQLRIMGDVS